jgi:hypothetical protein
LLCAPFVNGFEQRRLCRENEPGGFLFAHVMLIISLFCCGLYVSLISLWNSKPKETDVKDTRELRMFLVEQMTGVASGKVNIDKAKAMSNLAQQVYNTLNVEVRMATALAKAKESGADIKPVEFDA